MHRIMRKMADMRARSSMTAGLLLLCGVVALSACGGSSSASAPKLLPALQKAQTALKDATGAFTFISATKSLDLSGTGTTKITAHPQRSVETMKISSQTQQSTTIVDGPSTTYTQLLPTQSGQTGATTQWLKSTSINAIVQDVSEVLDYATYTNAVQHADATINGVTYLYITGVELPGNTVDLYLNKTTYLPVKALIHHSSDSPIDITVTFSATNTGATIDLPPASQVTVSQ